MPHKRSKPSLAQCKATASSGGPCKAKPHQDGLCFFHSDPKKAAELGRKGGRANRHTYETPPEHVAVPESAGEVKRMLAETMADIRAGRMDPKLGSTLGYVGTALLGPSRLLSSSSGSNNWSTGMNLAECICFPADDPASLRDTHPNLEAFLRRSRREHAKKATGQCRGPDRVAAA
jgi:general stress protein YciG